MTIIARVTLRQAQEIFKSPLPKTEYPNEFRRIHYMSSADSEVLLNDKFKLNTISFSSLIRNSEVHITEGSHTDINGVHRLVTASHNGVSIADCASQIRTDDSVYMDITVYDFPLVRKLILSSYGIVV